MTEFYTDHTMPEVSTNFSVANLGSKSFNLYPNLNSDEIF